MLIVPMNTKLLASLAFVAALAFVGGVAIETIVVIPQQAFAAPRHGCKPGSNAFQTTDRNCFHTEL
jgi:hypothetical protein